MDFKISNAICAGDQATSDVQQDFMYQVDKWRKSSQIRKISRGNRKNNTIIHAPDQRNQPFIPTHKSHHPTSSFKPSRTLSFASKNQNLSEDTNSIATDIEIKKFPEFNLANELPIQLIPLTTTNPPTSTTPNTSRSSSSRSMSDLRGSQSKGRPNPILQLIECENKIDEFQKEKLENQKKKQKMDSQGQLIPQPIKHVIPIFKNSPDKQKSSHQNQTVLLSDDYYYSKLVDHGQWSVIWDVNKIKNVPLILDRSDKYISFTDSNSDESKRTHVVRSWNNLNLLNVKPDFYSPMKSETQTNDDKDIHHSDIATSLALVEPHITDFEHFHHPMFKAPINKEMRITHEATKKALKNDSPYLNTIESLSGRNGDIYIIEHTFENPPFILNIGMNSLLITYYFKEKESDISNFTDDFIKTLKILEPNEQSPFIAQLPRNKPIQAIYCPLYRMPIAKHIQNETDFLLIKDMNEMKFYIRRFDDIFCAGMLEPQKEVMTPGSKTTQKFQDNFMNAVLINIFRGTPVMKKKEHVIVAHIHREYFPDSNEQKLRNLVKKYATFTREQGNGYWKFDPHKHNNNKDNKHREKEIDLDSDFNQLEITPESVCSYQSMLFGQWRLRQNGVSILKTEPRLYMQIKKLKGERTKLIAEKIDLELMKTPWAKTKSFTGAFQSNAIEMQNADGETVYRRKSRRQKASDNPEAAQKKKRKLVGTDADLRGLSLEALEQLLLSLNVPREKFQECTRWQKVGLVRTIANRHQQDNPNGNNKVSLYYARERNGYQEICNKYKQHYQQTFENNLNFISTPEEKKVEEKENNFEDVDILDELEREMMHNEQNEEEDDDLFEDTEALQEDQEKAKAKPKFQSSGDPKELVPYGICTYPTKIDWSQYGFDPNTQRREVVKLIHVSLNSTGVDVNVEWKRSPHEIKEMKTKQIVFLEGNGPQITKFNESILLDRKKEIDDKLRRRNSKKSKNGNVHCLGYIPNHTFLLVKEDGNGQFSFELTPDVVDQINKARKTYQDYEKNGRSSHFQVNTYSTEATTTDTRNSQQTAAATTTNTTATNATTTNSSSSSSVSISRAKPGASSGNLQQQKQQQQQQQPRKKKSIDAFNEELKKIINDLGKDSYLQFYSSKEANTPSLKACSQKCEKRGYKKAEDFIADIGQFREFYRGQQLEKKAEDMFYDFKNRIESNSRINSYEEHRKKKEKALAKRDIKKA
ncbi:hypothetical protein M9Y10_003347 [Tritrichomonas musculus]|uniref:Transcription initiation factor TFIID subunit 1 histone acetyltransferase domain-containing protein n=1 Tax=Tritrichomonas musculus TaxID=1915356 RepID=A0ABR2JP71_9EUKA